MFPRNVLIVFVVVMLELGAIYLYASSTDIDGPEGALRIFTRGTFYHHTSAAFVQRKDKQGSRKLHILGPNKTPPTMTSMCTSSKNKTQGYLLAVEYDQQLVGSFHGFSRLSKIASLLNLSTVEPYVQGTRTRGAPNLYAGDPQELVKMGMLYDLHHLQDTLNSCCALNKLVSFETLMQKVHQDIVFVCVFDTDTILFKTIFGNRPNKTIIEIDYRNFNAGLLRNFYVLNEWIFHISNQQTSKLGLSRVIAMDARPLHPLPLTDITEVLGSVVHEEVAKSGSVTVVLDKWRNIHSIRDSNFFYYVPGFTWESGCGIMSVQHSEAVMNAAGQFRQSLNQTHPVVGVHVRGERLLTEFQGNTSHYIHCLQELKNVLYGLTNSGKVAHESVHVFHDLGDFGSLSCTLKYCVLGRHQFLSQLKGLGFPVVSFDPTTLDSAPVNRGFAAFVEREYLTHVDILVTVGRGGFQNSIVDRFLKVAGGNTDNLHRICNSRHTPKKLIEP